MVDRKSIVIRPLRTSTYFDRFLNLNYYNFIVGFLFFFFTQGEVKVDKNLKIEGRKKNRKIGKSGNGAIKIRN